MRRWRFTCHCFEQEAQNPSPSLLRYSIRSSRARTCQRDPKVWDDMELGHRRSTTSFRSEGSKEEIVNKSELQVSYRGYNLSFLSTKSAPDPEELHKKGIIQTLQHEDQGIHLLDRQNCQIPREVTSLWDGTTLIRRRDPQSSGVLTPEGVTERTDHSGVRNRNPNTHRTCRVL